MSYTQGPETAFPFDKLHDEIMAVADAGYGPILMADATSAVEIDALPEDRELGLAAAIRVARVSLPLGTATIAAIFPGANGRTIVMEGSCGRVIREHDDNTELISYLVRHTSLQTVNREMSALFLEEVAADVNSLAASGH